MLYFFELTEKVLFLMEDKRALERFGHRPSVTSFSVLVRVDRKTLGKAIGNVDASPPEVGDGRLSKMHSYRIAEAFDFDPECPAWKNQSADEFREICLDRWSKRDQRPWALLARGTRQQPTTSNISGLASIEIDGAQFGYGTVDISIELSCGVVTLQGRQISIKSGRVELDCTKGELSEESRKLLRGPRRELSGSKGTVILQNQAGVRNRPAIRLDSATGTIGDIDLEPGLLAFHELRPDSVITVKFVTWLMDIQELDEVADAPAAGFADGVAIVEADGSEAMLPSENLSVLKRKVIAVLRKEVLPVEEGTGIVRLASHELRFTAAAEE